MATSGGATALVPAGESLTAHPVAVLAIPAFIPVVVIVATILWVARKDRLAAAAEGGGAERVADPAQEPVVVASAPAGSAPRGSDESVKDPEPRRSWRDRLPRLVIGDEE